MSNTLHTQLPENLIVVDREWLEGKLNRINKQLLGMNHNKTTIRYKELILQKKCYEAVKANSFPVTPILEDYWSKAINSIEDLEPSLQSYLSQPITLKSK
jgi:hypothetical protein